MTPTELKANFDRSYAGVHQPMPDIDAYIAGEDDIPEVEYEIPLGTFDLPEDAALKMIEAQVYYWEHYGWLKAAIQAIHEIAGKEQYELAQRYAQWLEAELPKGYEEVEATKDLCDWAAGDFPKEKITRQNKMIDMLKNRNFEPVPAWKTDGTLVSA
ncbi:hypothetical protein Lepto7375DRAFT_7355 [Leptolyngbya sp. PCC 7375]|nr:hypothetical protein Lepto7375DRAFT_0568 [Leptolyngbya sp. PCC 7375]EKU98094.1 hypothetical protein Lepto7375DRAFT_7355 [Leptolyngbya sp. PCC 7375]